MRVARDIHVEFDAPPDHVAVVVCGLVEWLERRLAEEVAVGRVAQPDVRVTRGDVRQPAAS